MAASTASNRTRARKQKSESAFRTISEVAEGLDVPQHVLRFWETKFFQVKPLKRAGGRRYYRPEDIDLLRGIRFLLYDQGYTIRGVRKVLRENGPRSVIETGQRLGRGEALGGVTAASEDEGLGPLPEEPQDEARPIAQDAPAQGDLLLDTGSLSRAQRSRLGAVLLELEGIRDLLKSVRTETA